MCSYRDLQATVCTVDCPRRFERYSVLNDPEIRSLRANTTPGEVSYMRHEKCEKPELFLLLCTLFNNSVSISDSVASDDWIVMN